MGSFVSLSSLMLCTSVNHRVMLPGWPPRSLVYVGLGFCREVHLKSWTVESGVPTMVSCLFLGMDGKRSSTRTANHLEVHLSEFCSSCCIHWTMLSWACVFESTVLVGNNISQASPRAFEYRSWNVKIPFWWKKIHQQIYTFNLHFVACSFYSFYLIL